MLGAPSYSLCAFILVVAAGHGLAQLLPGMEQKDAVHQRMTAEVADNAADAAGTHSEHKARASDKGEPAPHLPRAGVSLVEKKANAEDVQPDLADNKKAQSRPPSWQSRWPGRSSWTSKTIRRGRTTVPPPPHTPTPPPLPPSFPVHFLENRRLTISVAYCVFQWPRPRT